jgi:MFS family permease
VLFRSDRWGRRRALVAFALAAAAGYAIYLAAPSWGWIVAGTLLVSAWSSLTLPATFAVLGDHLARSRRAMGFSIQAILKRVPILVAPPLGGWLIGRSGLAQGMKIGLGVTLLLALASAVLLHRTYRELPPPRCEEMRLPKLWRTMDGGLKRLLVADCLARWAEGLPKVFIVLFVVDVLGASPARFGALVGLQAAASALVYLPVARLADRLDRKPFVLVTFAFFALYPLALATSWGSVSLALAFLAGGLRETGEPARKALILDLAPPGARGRAVGLYYLVRGLAVFPAPLAGGWLWALDRRAPFYAAFAAGIAGFLVHARWGPADLSSPRAQSPDREAGC